MIFVILEVLGACTLLTFAILGLNFGYVTLGWIGVVVSLLLLAHVMFLVSTNRVKTPRGLASGVPIYDGRDDDSRRLNHRQAPPRPTRDEDAG